MDSVTDVYIRAGFTKIYDIDTINQRFQAELLFRDHNFNFHHNNEMIVE